MLLFLTVCWGGIVRVVSAVWGQAGTSVCSLPTGSFTDYVCSFPNQNTVYDFLDGKLFIYVNTTANPTGAAPQVAHNQHHVYCAAHRRLLKLLQTGLLSASSVERTPFFLL